MTSDKPEWAKDTIVLTNGHHFSWGDRVRILCGWEPVYTTMIATEELPGRTLPYSGTGYYKRPGWWPFHPKSVGYESCEAMPQS